jgi:hypothetical protein
MEKTLPVSVFLPLIPHRLYELEVHHCPVAKHDKDGSDDAGYG